MTLYVYFQGNGSEEASTFNFSLLSKGKTPFTQQSNGLKSLESFPSVDQKQECFDDSEQCLATLNKKEARINNLAGKKGNTTRDATSQPYDVYIKTS